MTSVPLGTRIQADLLERLKELSRVSGRSIRWLVEKGVELVLEKYKNGDSDG
jgi:hypothetical protein